MTSPAQLKYLDAMGIPVWVSRDLIVEESNSIEFVPTLLNQPALKTQPPSSLASPSPVNQTSSAAQNILNSLDDSSVNSRTYSPNVESNTSIREVIAESVDNAKITSESGSESSATSSFANQNLLFKSLHHHVYACGSETADWMVVGHSPEPFNGIGQEPFADEAGELLNNMLRAVGIEQPRSQAYLLNVIDINQSANIDEESLIQTKLKLKQDLLSVIEKNKPKIILFVGQIAPQILLGSTDPLIIMRSKVHKINDNNIPCIVTYYPSYLLQKPTDKRKAWDDLKLAMSQLRSL